MPGAAVRVAVEQLAGPAQRVEVGALEVAVQAGLSALDRGGVRHAVRARPGHGGPDHLAVAAAHHHVAAAQRVEPLAVGEVVAADPALGREQRGRVAGGPRLWRRRTAVPVRPLQHRRGDPDGLHVTGSPPRPSRQRSSAVAW
jgi:hypothetical protein